MGLGNPGSRYSRTRHNVGFWVADRIGERVPFLFKKPWFRPYLYGEAEYRGNRVCAAKPLTFMNRSGEIVFAVLKRSKLDKTNLLVVCDTMDLPAGSLRLKNKGSSAGHNGLKSLIARLGTEEFTRLYVGIGRPEPGTDVIAHVLGEPPESERTLLEAAAHRAAEGILRLLDSPREVVMNELNRN